MTSVYLTRRRRAGAIGAATERGNRSVLTHFVVSVGDRSVGQLQRRHVQRWWAGVVESTKSDRTKRHEFTVVRSFCRWLHVEGYLRGDFFAGMRVPRMPDPAPRPLADDAVASLFRAAPDERGRAVVALSCLVGLRAMEIAGARVEDWNQRDRTLRVLGKGRRVRMVPITREVERHLVALLAAEGWPRTGPFVRSRNHPSRGLTPYSVGRLFSGIAYDAKVKARPGDGVSCHAGRHTAATNVADRSGDIRLVQELLGHANVSTSMIYTAAAGLERLRRVLEAPPVTAA